MDVINRTPRESVDRVSMNGTVEQVAEKIKTYVDLGCTGFYPWCSDYPETTSMELLAQRVVPEVRRLAR